MKNAKAALKLMTFAVAVVVALGVVVAASKSYFDKRDVVVRVESKERVCEGGKDGGCNYLIFTDGGTFKVGDALIGTTRFNSSDVYGRIKQDSCYRLHVYGWRFGPLSMYPNIVNAAEVSC